MEESFKTITNRIGYFLKWVFIGIIVGATAGLVGAVFHLALGFATTTRQQNPWIIWLLPLAGLVIVYLYKITNQLGSAGTNLVLTAIRNESEKPKLITVPLIFISTALTHLFGGSAGREGAALQLGAGVSVFIGKKLRLSDKDMAIISMCGMSAGFSALFGTPFTATIFSMEVTSVGIMYYSAFVPSIISAIIARKIAMLFGIPKTFFSISAVPEATILNLARVLVLGALLAGVSYVFCLTIHKAGKFYNHLFKSAYIKIFVGGIIVSIFSLITTKYCGAGMDVIIGAIEGQSSSYYDFILKIILTAITLGAGFKGGEIVPAFFTGATFGSAYSKFLGLPSGFGGAIGLIGVFCASTNCPLSAVALGLELFGAEGLIFFSVVSAVSYMLSGYTGLYSEQKIMYSKYRAEYINKKTE